MIAKLRTEKIFNFGTHDHVDLAGVRGTDRARPRPGKESRPRCLWRRPGDTIEIVLVQRADNPR